MSIRRLTAAWIGAVAGATALCTGAYWWVGHTYEAWNPPVAVALAMVVESLTTSGFAFDVGRGTSDATWTVLSAIQAVGIVLYAFTFVVAVLWIVHLSDRLGARPEQR